jgi:hypothetical protein
MKMTCPHCAQHIEADDECAGMKATCPTCNGVFSLLPKIPAPVPIVQSTVKALAIPKSRFKSEPFKFVWAGCIVSLVLLSTWYFFGNHSNGTVSSIVNQSSLSEEDVKVIFHKYFNGNVEVKDEQTFPHTVSCAQYWFDLMHPVGNAKGVEISDVVLNRNNYGKIQSVGVQAVLHWQGPLQSGSTTFKVLYDAAANQFRNLSVVSSDGITRNDVNDFANGFVIGSQLGEAISDK